MKATFISGRVDRSGRHNDRNFNVALSRHIDQTKTGANKYWTYNNEYDKTFLQTELEFYTSNFFSHINEQNNRNIAGGHSERNKTVEQYLKNKITQPEDIIVQIGNKDEHASAEELWDCVLEFQKQFDEAYGEHCKIIDMALHLDEATPHVHIRRAWIAEDNYGNKCVSENKALRNMGIVAPDYENNQNRSNNPKVTFTAIERKMFENICMEKGIDIKIDNRQRTEHLSVNQFKAKKIKEEIERAEAQLEEIERQRVYTEKEIEYAGEIVESANEFIESTFSLFQSNEYLMELYEEDLKKIREQQEKEDLAKLYYLYLKLFEKAFMDIVKSNNFEKSAIRADIQSQYEKMKRFIEQKGLEKEYQRYKENHGQRGKQYQKDLQKREW